MYIKTRRLNFQPTTTYLGVKLDRTFCYRQYLVGLRDKVMARSALICKLVGTGRGASLSTLRKSALALVYAPAEYCAPTWSRSRHTNLLDVNLNCILPIITGCLQPTPVEQLPVLSGIPPAELRRRAASLALTRHAMDPDHLLHHTITWEETQFRLKFRRLFATSGKDLLSTTLSNEIKAHWIARMWSAEWQPSISGLLELLSHHPSAAQDLTFQDKPGSNLIGYPLESGASMLICGDGAYPSVEPATRSRRVDSKSHHHRVPLYLPPNGLPGLMDVDADAATREWLLS